MSRIEVNSVSLELPIYNQNAFSIRSQFKRFSHNERFGHIDSTVIVHALKDVSVSLKENDRLGLIGPNGAGKTTLLRMMAGIYKPSRGSVFSEGKISCLFGTGFGMDEDATGYENIFLCGLFLGISQKEMKKRVDEIIEFSELNEFIYLPIRTYSAGMRARLSFSIATSYKPEILLMDEGVGAGDARFFKKARKRLSSFMMKSSVLVLASHSNTLIKDFCNRVLYLEKGSKVAEGSVESVLKQYMDTVAE